MFKKVSLSSVTHVGKAEGWKLKRQPVGSFAGKVMKVMIVRDTCANRFECDVDAEQYVRYRAAHGSPMHRVALKAHRLPVIILPLTAK
jgi:hypothetical protein